MVDFWTDEKDLATKVIIALSKIFTKAPRTGWVRANKAMSPEVADELALLSRENRILKDELEGIKNKIALRKPKFEVLFNNSKIISEGIVPDSELIEKSKIYLKPIIEIERDLSRYINAEKLKHFNSIILKNGPDVIDYNEKVLQFERRSKTGIDYNIVVKNIGTAKANNVVVDIEFPKEVLVCDKNSLPKSFKTSAPKSLGSNPVDEARATKRRREDRDSLMVLNEYDLSFQPKILAHSLNFNSNFEVEDNIVKLNFLYVLHTQSNSISEEINIIPLKEGRFNLIIKIICEEFDSPEEFIFPIDVINKTSAV
jgi:hypothetical protein